MFAAILVIENMLCALPAKGFENLRCISTRESVENPSSARYYAEPKTFRIAV